MKPRHLTDTPRGCACAGVSPSPRSRSDEVAECGTREVESPTRPPPQIVFEELVDSRGEHHGPPASCPAPLHLPPGDKGAPCSSHPGCFAPAGLICAKLGEAAGRCRKVACSSDSQCQASTSLPIRCSHGSCVMKHCYSKTDCPRGYACYSDGQCKLVSPPISSRSPPPPPGPRCVQVRL